MKAALLIAAVCFWGQALWAQDHGQALYEGRAALSVDLGGTVVLAMGIPCAGCHGHDAAGGREAGSGPALTDLDPIEILRALTEGIGADGRRLAPVMPRFVFAAPTDAGDLVRYITGIAERQRTGLSEDALLVNFGDGAAAKRFSQAFLERVGQIAPRGVFGRRILQGAVGKGFVTLAASRPAPAGAAPDLFPLYMLRGDEDPRRVRGGFASLNDQVAALSGTAVAGAVLDPEGRDPALPDGWPVVDVLPGDGPVIVLGAAAGQVDPRARPILMLADDIGHLGAIAGCVTVADPRPTTGGPATAPVDRYGRAAADVLILALTRCGRDCTRAALFEALDDIAIDPPGWPRLDYQDHPLTGTSKVALRRICLGN